MYRMPTLALFAWLLGISGTTADDRVAMPAQEELEKATKLVHELFKSDYAKTAPKARAALAEKLFRQAEETSDDPAAQYVLLRETAELASAGSDVELALPRLIRFACGQRRENRTGGSVPQVQSSARPDGGIQSRRLRPIC